jgi:predicted transcriptional regulator
MKRNPIQLNVAILIACKDEPLKLTHIMYSTGINCSIAKIIIDKLTEQKLLGIVIVKNYDCYSTTKEGRDILRKYEEVRSILERTPQVVTNYMIAHK